MLDRSFSVFQTPYLSKLEKVIVSLYIDDKFLQLSKNVNLNFKLSKSIHSSTTCSRSKNPSLLRNSFQ